MKAITLWQPWASFMVSGHKRYETRSWYPEHRGPIVVHAAKRWTRADSSMLNHFVLKHPELAEYAAKALPLGVVLAEFKLVNIYRTELIRDRLEPLERALGDYGNNRFAWEMELVKVFDTPIPASGMQLLWEWRGQ